MISQLAQRWDSVAFGVVGAVMLAASIAVVTVVDLSPKVEADFFFSSDDPAFAASRQIDQLFPGERQIIVAAKVSPAEQVVEPSEEPTSPAWLQEQYVERVGRLSEALTDLEGVTGVRSLTHGPASPSAVVASPIWGRLLLATDEGATYLIVSLEPAAEDQTIGQIEAILEDQRRPSFELAASGVPYVVELIRRHLRRDIRVFSAAALVVFGLVISILYRSIPLVVGTLLSCVGACVITLAALRLLGVPIGLLTANIATIVFVLTLSHTVFLSSNWRRLRTDSEPRQSMQKAVGITLTASFWCMVAALMGFASLQLASAKPLRELGTSGLVGTTVAMLVAYGFYPTFLRWANARPARSRAPLRVGQSSRIAAVLVTLVILAATGIGQLETDPSLFSYFGRDTELARGLELIDKGGGSSPLLVVVTAPDGGSFEGRAEVGALRAFQDALDQDPAVGMSISLPLLLDEAKRVPFASFLPTSKLLDILGSEAFGSIAADFVTPERDRALVYLRMREHQRSKPRAEIVAGIEAAAIEADLEPVLIGGLFDLQSKLGALVKSSLLTELGGLLFFFVGIAAVVARSVRGATAMVGCLAGVAALLLGSLGHLGRPVDVISAPAVNVAIALGIDGMIHLLLAVRRQRERGLAVAAAWRAALENMQQPILGALAILALGFGIFTLSSFPPTQRFGAVVAFGTLASAVMTLSVLPLLAVARRSD